jgi:hypothetical protein
VTLAKVVRRLRRELGLAGLLALVLLALAGLFSLIELKPMQARNNVLAERLAHGAPGPSPAALAAEKLAVFYQYLDKGEDTTDWLAKLYGIGKATGVELHSANYRVQSAGGRMERYEMVLPLTGDYRQVREFLRRALAEIPVLSLDQLTLRRESRSDAMVQAEVRLTLHRVKS